MGNVGPATVILGSAIILKQSDRFNIIHIPNNIIIHGLPNDGRVL